MLDSIRLTNLEVKCIVGVYPSERLTPQSLILDLELFLDTRPSAEGGFLRQSVDYTKLCGEVEFLLRSCQFLLLEEAAEGLSRYLLAAPLPSMKRAQVEAITLTLTKPQALGGKAIPSLTVRRCKDDYTYIEEATVFGKVDILYETKQCGIYRLRIDPLKHIPTHVHKHMQEHEFILSENLRLQGQLVAAGTGYAWPKNHPHRYDNPSKVEQVILCIDRPSFQSDDEVEVDVPLDSLLPVEGHNYYRSVRGLDVG